MTGDPNTEKVWMNDLTDEQAERCRERARELCTCGGAGIPPLPWPCGGHLRRAIDEGNWR